MAPGRRPAVAVVAASALLACYRIDPSHSQAAATELLGEDFGGFVVSVATPTITSWTSFSSNCAGVTSSASWSRSPSARARPAAAAPSSWCWRERWSPPTATTSSTATPPTGWRASSRYPAFQRRSAPAEGQLRKLAAGLRGEHLIRYSRQGLNPLCQVAKARFGYKGPPRFAGVHLSAPDESTAWDMAYQIAGGEYGFPDLTPRKGERVIDIGANIGVFALWAARQDASVIAYEPAPINLGHLMANVRARPAIRVVWGAVVGSLPEGGAVRLYLHDDRSTRHTLLGREIGTGEVLERHADVPAISIEDVLAHECDLLKIDCEGGEFDILAHVSEKALRRAGRIVLEFHRTINAPAVLLDRLRGSGFRAAVLAGEHPDQPFGVIGAHRL